MFESILIGFIIFLFLLVSKRKRNPKIYITGHARHGKDTVAELLAKKTDMAFTSSSWICLNKFLYDKLKVKYGYTSKVECFEDRVNKRTEWFNAIARYNVPDGSKLSRLIFSQNDVYVGLRNVRELNACKRCKVSPYSLKGIMLTIYQILFSRYEPFTYGVHDFVIWVDATSRKPKESPESMSIQECDSEYTINNNGTEEELSKEVDRLITWFQRKGFK
jgi:hypothetical protein